MTTLRTLIKPQRNTSQLPIIIPPPITIIPMILLKNNKNKLSNMSDQLNNSSEPLIINPIAPYTEKNPQITIKAPHH